MFADLAPGVDLADELRWEATGQGRILNASAMSAVPDASACLAYLQRQGGAEVVAPGK
jgi:hypothetical protein